MRMLIIVLCLLVGNYANAQISGLGILRAQSVRVQTDVYSHPGALPTHKTDSDSVPKSGQWTTFSGYSSVFKGNATVTINDGADTAGGMVHSFDAISADGTILDTAAEKQQSSHWQFQTYADITTDGAYAIVQSALRGNETKLVQAILPIRVKWKISFAMTVPDMSLMSSWLLVQESETKNCYASCQWDGWNKKWVVDGWCLDANGNNQNIHYDFVNRNPGDNLSFYFYAYDFIEGDEVVNIVTQVNDIPDWYRRGQIMRAYPWNGDTTESNSGNVTIDYIQSDPWN